MRRKKILRKQCLKENGGVAGESLSPPKVLFKTNCTVLFKTTFQFPPFVPVIFVLSAKRFANVKSWHLAETRRSTNYGAFFSLFFSGLQNGKRNAFHQPPALQLLSVHLMPKIHCARYKLIGLSIRGHLESSFDKTSLIYVFRYVPEQIRWAKPRGQVLVWSDSVRYGIIYKNIS
ncbi:hypothetical protein E2320_000361 [Naja naja]|nr:hypothetical protein E2320_000361 [Naja naja]